MADFLLDSDVVIWHLRGQESVVDLSRRGRLGLSVVTRAEVIQGMREPERESTFLFLDGCETLRVDQVVGDLFVASDNKPGEPGSTCHSRSGPAEPFARSCDAA